MQVKGKTIVRYGMTIHSFECEELPNYCFAMRDATFLEAQKQAVKCFERKLNA